MLFRSGADGVRVHYVLYPIHAVDRVEFRGTLGIDEGDLRRAVVERFGAAPPAGRADDVRQMVEALYHERGVVSPTLTSRIDVTHNPDRASMVFEIASGPQAVIRAIHTVQALSGAKQINTLGFCVGGTLLATALAVLAARGEHPAASMTLLTTLLDFSDTGMLDVFIDEAAVQLREVTIGDKAPGGPKLLKGQELATAFNFLRPNDLVWNYVVGNYLKGEMPPAFDLLYWNGDSTNLPGPMYCWYLRNTYLENRLREPGALTVCGERLDLGLLKLPIYLYASREDHIVPWQSAYASTRLFQGPRRFVLGASGHIAGVINPPEARKRSHWINEQLPAQAQAWQEGAQEHPGSWWTDWSAWLAPLSGRQVAAPKSYGGKGYQAIEPAPGRYVKTAA